MKSSSSSLAQTLRRIALSAWMPVVALVIIWIVTTQSPSVFFPPLPSVLESFVTTWFGEGFVTHVLPSLSNLAVGFAIALVVGVGLGLILSALPLAHALVNPYAQFLRALPGVALLPLLIMLMGTNNASKIVLIAFGAVWPILLNTIDGIALIPREQREAVASYRVRPIDIVTRLLLPGAFPRITVGIRLSLSIALVLMVGSEYYGATQGIGFYVLQAKQTFHTDEMWSGVLLLGLIGYVLSMTYGLLERRLLAWKELQSTDGK